MQNYDCDYIENIQENIYNKLLDCADFYFNVEQLSNSIDFFYPDFDEQKADKAFLLWMVSDYRSVYNKSLIEHVLEEYEHIFTKLERQVLMDQRDSFLSLYKVEAIEGDFIRVQDLITREESILTDPRSVNIVKAGDLIYARILNILGVKKFSPYFSFLPSSLKEDFVSEIIFDFNKRRLVNQNLSLKQYLKCYSLTVYRIYTELIYELIRIDEDKISQIYSELDNFEAYMENYIPIDKIREFSDNLINFFEYYLIDKKLTIDDIPNIDFEYILVRAIEEGYISSKEDFISYAHSFKYYLKYLKCTNKKFAKSYKKILDIYENLFHYIEYINKMDHPFKLDQDFSRKLSRNLSEKAFNLVMNYDKFLMYLIDNPLRLEDGQILYSDIVDLAYSIVDPFDDEFEFDDKRDMELFNLFYSFSLNFEIAEVKSNFFILTKKAAQFLKLKDEDKYSLLLKFVFSGDFKNYTSGKKEIKSFFTDLAIKEIASYPKIYDETYMYYRYLEILDLVEIKDNLGFNIEISPFGKFIYKNLYMDRSLENRGKVLVLSEYR